MFTMIAGTKAIRTPQARRAAGKSSPTVMDSRAGTTYFASHMDKKPESLARLVIGFPLEEGPATDSSKVTLDCDANHCASDSERTEGSCVLSPPTPGNRYSAQVEKATLPRLRPFDSPQMKKWQSTSQ